MLLPDHWQIARIGTSGDGTRFLAQARADHPYFQDELHVHDQSADPHKELAGRNKLAGHDELPDHYGRAGQQAQNGEGASVPSIVKPCV